MSGEPRNIQLFNRIVGIVLTTLYESFPSGIDLNPRDIGARACEGFTDDHGEMFQIMSKTADETIEFLIAEGFLTHDPGQQTFDSAGIYHSARLTMKGLAILGLPGSVSPESTVSLGAQLRDAVNEGASETVSGIVGRVLEGALSMGVKVLTQL